MPPCDFAVELDTVASGLPLNNCSVRWAFRFVKAWQEFGNCCHCRWVQISVHSFNGKPKATVFNTDVNINKILTNERVKICSIYCHRVTLLQFVHGDEMLLKCLRRMYSKSRSWMLSEMPNTRLLVPDTLWSLSFRIIVASEPPELTVAALRLRYIDVTLPRGSRPWLLT